MGGLGCVDGAKSTRENKQTEKEKTQLDLLVYRITNLGSSWWLSSSFG